MKAIRFLDVKNLGVNYYVPCPLYNLEVAFIPQLWTILTFLYV